MPPTADFDPDDPTSGFDREIAILRSLAVDPVTLDAPPAGTWDAIESALGREQDDPASPAVTADRPRVIRGDAPATSSPSAARPRWQWLAAAAAVVAVLVAGAVVVATRGEDGPAELAATTLRPVNGVDVGRASASATLQRDGTHLQLHVEMDDLPSPPSGTFYELWLLGEDGETPVSLATMKEPAPSVSTDVDIPAGVDTGRYDVVDVSLQAEGEGPEHSGNSVLRGTLSA